MRIPVKKHTPEALEQGNDNHDKFHTLDRPILNLVLVSADVKEK